MLDTTMDLRDIQKEVGDDVIIYPMCMECMLGEYKNFESVYVFCLKHCSIKIEEREERIYVYVTPKQ